MTSQEQAPEQMQCATHPGVVTNLRCGRCEKPICPRCMEMTPGGQRCRTCANLRPPPAYDVPVMLKLRAAAAAAGVGLAGGVLWRFLPQLGLFILLLAVGFGYLMAAAISRASNRKRGYALQLTAGFGVLLAYFVRNLLLAGLPVLPRDLFGYLAVGIAILVAISPLR